MTLDRAAPGAVVEGPIAGGAHGWPFAASLDDLGALGYVEEEFFVEGEAGAFAPVGDLGMDGRWDARPADTASFCTRVLVQRPADPDRFNGTVVVGWNNVTAGYELLAELPSILEEGFAYACVSAQQVGIDGVGAAPEGLRVWDPDRYEALRHPGDRYSYGIFTEVALACGPDRRLAGADPMGGLDVHRLIALGASQSAARLATYLNAVQPLTGSFDAFLVLIHFGSGAALDDNSIFDANAPSSSSVFHARTRVRDDLDVPVMIVNSETETLAYAASRQDASDRFCFWEVAGAAHVSAPQMARRRVKTQRDGVSVRASPNPESTVSYAPAASAALLHLDRWASEGDPPPPQPLIDLRGDPPTISRDGHDNATGGVRMPQMTVPVAHNTGVSLVEGLGGLGGGHIPFPRDLLVSLYGTPERYAARFAEAADAAVAAGTLRRSEAEGLVEESRRFDGF